MKRIVKTRTLFDCLHAKYPATGDYIICDKGHKLGNGYIGKRQVDRGDLLVCGMCQTCKDFEDMND